MVIKNLTPKSQELRIVEIVGGREFTVYIEGNGCTELQGAYIADTSQLGKCLEIVDGYKPHTTEETPIIIQSNENDETEDGEGSDSIIEDTQVDENDESQESEEDEDDSVDGDSKIAEDKFICDICGAEFASQRGLDTHKSRSHSNDN